MSPHVRRHWVYVKGGGRKGTCSKCGRTGYFNQLLNPLGSGTMWRVCHYMYQGAPRTCWGVAPPKTAWLVAVIVETETQKGATDRIEGAGLKVVRFLDPEQASVEMV